MPTDITALASYGLSGVCIALVILIGFLFNRISTMMSNHIDHNTEAWNINSKVLTQLTAKMDEDIKAQQQTAETLRDLQHIIQNQK